ncbi:molybdopterin-dependent oxidoreductase [Enterovirga rhinocerotis]|uniref:Molybdopterin-dependent oxidoreductase iron-sulfur protein n=1 Tax=Enterovirga rhinocerotis TaxID=1339210 RepID=A0A4R7C475_9HYPH|nr:molybdopterin-dependent oxidoreductase [Enterovirga rhinocerotis]TDR93274.1 molybdopterin-dependent oxidoreductase iron-sulfur protein [Enterovirga rhinocerotis]
MARRYPGYCTLCRSRCGSVTVVENGRMTGVEPLPGHPTGGALCAKGRAAPELVHSPRRLTVPLRRTRPKGEGDPGWVEISWDEALDEVASRLGSVRRESGAEAVAFAVTTPSGTPMVDSSEWVERFVRCFGSPNIIYAVEVCGWHKDYAHAYTFGRGIGFPDYEQADAIVLWGHNPARTWLAQATRIADAKRRGATVAVVDPKPSGSGQLADLWLRIRPGADAALAMAAIRHLIATETYDSDFVTRWTNGPLLVDAATGRFVRAGDVGLAGEPEAFVVLGAEGRPVAYDTRRPLAGPVRLDAEAVLTGAGGARIEASTAFRLLREEAEPYTAAAVSTLTWLDEDSIRAFTALFEGAPRLAYHSWTGVGQHSNATAIERSIATLYALTGACDREGGNVWAVPPPTRAVNDLSLLPPGQKEKALGLDRLPLGPPAKGWVTARDFAAAALEGSPYRVRALMSWGTNFLASQSDADRNRAALHALDFHVHADMFMNPTAEQADIVLPVNMPWEREALRIGFEITQAAAETIQFREAMLPRHGEAKADYEIAFALAGRLEMGEHFFGGDIRAGWNHQIAPLGITLDDLKPHPGGRRFPQSFRHGKYGAPAEDGSVPGFATRTRRAELYSELLLDHGQAPLPSHVEPGESPFRADADARFPLVLTTAKNGWFVHTSHRHVASLRKKSPDPAVEISPALAASRGLREGDWTIVETQGGTARLRARINEALDDRVVVAEFGWWEDCPPLGRSRSDGAAGIGSNLNAILSDRHADPVSGSVPLRAITCEIRPDMPANRGRWRGRRAFAVTRIRREGEETVALDLAPRDGAALPDALAGQHVELSLPGEAAGRSYSLTGGCDAPTVLSLGIRRQPSADGKPSLSERVHALRAGDEVLLTAPSGVFNPPLGGTRPIVFLAAGIGITPFLSHLETLALRPAASRPSEIRLFHGCRHGELHPFAERLAELDAALPELRRVTAYSAPRPEDRPGLDYDHRGRIDISSLEPILDRRPLVYLCGSSGFVTDMKAALVRIGIFAFDIFAEAFVSPASVPDNLAPQEIRLAGSDASFLWQPEAGSLLDAAHRAGVPLPSGCRVGQCESCAVTVVAGEVAHLVEVDTEPGRCLACMAVPLGPVTLAIQ